MLIFEYAFKFVYALLKCDWLWENLPVTHKDNYVEKRN